jgi:NADH-quinone oxidoreductase subunit L
MPQNPTLAWLIPVGPFVAFAIIALGAHRSRALTKVLAIASIVQAVFLSQVMFWRTVRAPGVERAALLKWYVLGTEGAGLGVYLDPTAVVMVAMVSFVCLMIFVYSIAYMRQEPRASRFFAYITLFAGAMLGAVVCDSLLVLFLFWEIMGTCSYLLIGFWWEKAPAANAALKAFLITKIGDLFLILGLVLLYTQVGSLSYAEVFSAETVARLSATPYLGGVSAATMAGLLLFGGTVGKSAQLPLHVWLPDAMEGPTPASALIHAATMVSAGVYLMVRAFPLLMVSEALPIVAAVGAATALYASVVAITQSDIKRVLAFSTISQLGYMVAAVGIGAYAAALFHLITHAFFKALLFLAAGSVIHGIEHGHQHTFGHAVPPHAASPDFSPNDMWKMGGLAFRMPLTALSYLCGSMALAGFPLITAGFWSKDEILAQAWSLDRLVFWVLVVAAALTGFYTSRQISLVFLGAPRSRAAVYARDGGGVMTTPLLVLALFAVGLGWLGIPEGFPVLGRLLPGWFSPFVSLSVPSLGAGQHALSEAHAVAWQPLALSIAFALSGLFLGWWVYARRPIIGDEAQADPVQMAMNKLRLPWLYRAVQERLYIDDIYRWVVSRPAVAAATALSTMDRRVIDAPIVAFGRGFGQAGQIAPAADRLDRGLVDRIVEMMGALSRLLAQIAVRIDDGLIDGIVKTTVNASRASSGASGFFDGGFIDGVVNGIAHLTGALGRWSRKMQSGQLPDYLWNAFMIIILLAAVLVLLQRI